MEAAHRRAKGEGATRAACAALDQAYLRGAFAERAPCGGAARRVPTCAQTTALLSVVWMQASVAGVVFCGPTLDDVAAVAYDTDELQVYKLTKAT